MDALHQVDPVIAGYIDQETIRQTEKIRLIPSENYVSQAVYQATGSVLTNKYSEGYPTKRYYEGQQYIDPIEQVCIERAKALFKVDHANVQPYSGSPANLAVYFAFCQPGDTIMGLGLPFGGHLTHGWSVSISGKYFKSVAYEVKKDTGVVDLDQVRDLAKLHRPKLLFCGGSAVPRTVDFAGFAKVAREVGAILVADIAHIAGLIAGGAHPSPVGHAEVMTTTTHKTLRGPRSGMILCNWEHAQKIDRAIFPGLQGGPHNHHTAAVAVALKEASSEHFREYAFQIVKNAKALAEELLSKGYRLVSGGTDNHLILMDLTNQGVSGKQAARALDAAGIETNANSVPFDVRKPMDPSGLRIGTPAITTRGMKEKHMRPIADWIHRAIQSAEQEHEQENIFAEVKEFTAQFPIPKYF
jgi:glycine hydroxymethyltransferase